jgi:hypothetical protein
MKAGQFPKEVTANSHWGFLTWSTRTCLDPSMGNRWSRSPKSDRQNIVYVENAFSTRPQVSSISLRRLSPMSL